MIATCGSLWGSRLSLSLSLGRDRGAKGGMRGRLTLDTCAICVWIYARQTARVGSPVADEVVEAWMTVDGGGWVEETVILWSGMRVTSDASQRTVSAAWGWTSQLSVRSSTLRLQPPPDLHRGVSHAACRQASSPPTRILDRRLRPSSHYLTSPDVLAQQPGGWTTHFPLRLVSSLRVSRVALVCASDLRLPR